MKMPRQELYFDGSTSIFTIDFNLTPFGASGVQPIDPITNLIPPNDFSDPNYPRNPPFLEKYCTFRKSTLSSRILVREKPVVRYYDFWAPGG